MIQNRHITDWDKLPVVLDVPTACCIFCCCDRTVVKLLKEKKIQGQKLGKQWVIDRDSVRHFIQGKEAIT